MSLSLVQDYSSEEEEERFFVDSDQDEEEPSPSKLPMNRAYSEPSNPQKSSLLPSPDDLFSEVTGPPDFLKSAATEPIRARPRDNRQPAQAIHYASNFSTRAQSKTDLQRKPPIGAVLEAKAKTVELHKETQGYSDNGANDSKVSPSDSAAAFTKLMENSASTEAEKRNRSKIKDKERSKRMKGQSSHATWKSETEMHLRQQFD